MARRRHDLQLPNEPQAKLEDEALELIRPAGECQAAIPSLH
jgi:hypothetical protein